jgi:hypothetical protein
MIDKSLIFINSEETFDTQESTIREEITQSLGLAFDSKKYSNSIFYKDKAKRGIKIKEYSQLDRDILRLLYHGFGGLSYSWSNVNNTTDEVRFGMRSNSTWKNRSLGRAIGIDKSSPKLQARYFGGNTYDFNKINID